ncbi:MAG: hypothetical protein GY702_03735 [Desulfobulbaceae bacterium]|nr:hypothetical protein [Desulfobulbaceae bacterium]
MSNDSTSESACKAIGDCLQLAMAQGLGREGLVFPVDCASLPEGEHKVCCQRLEKLFRDDQRIVPLRPKPGRWRAQC